MMVTAHAIVELRAAHEARRRALRRLEVLEGIGAHLGLTVTARSRRVRVALCALREAELVRLAAAEREHRWYMAHRRVRGRVLELAREALRL